MMTGELPDDISRARADYVKKKSRKYTRGERDGDVLFDSKDGLKVAITSAAQLDTVVSTSLATNSALCTRGQNVRRDVSYECVLLTSRKP